MAATGYMPIQLYYTTVSGRAPTAGNLASGELAINVADGKLYYKDTVGAIQFLGTKGEVNGTSTTQVLFNLSGAMAGSANFLFTGTTIVLANVPTSATGLPTGGLWKDTNGFLKVA
jgi:hypothetical protein